MSRRKYYLESQLEFKEITLFSVYDKYGMTYYGIENIPEELSKAIQKWVERETYPYVFPCDIRSEEDYIVLKNSIHDKDDIESLQLYEENILIADHLADLIETHAKLIYLDQLQSIIVKDSISIYYESDR